MSFKANLEGHFFVYNVDRFLLGKYCRNLRKFSLSGKLSDKISKSCPFGKI